MPKIIKTFVETTNTTGWYFDSELPGFCLRVRVGKTTGTITKSYCISNKPKGSRKSVTITIGKHPVMFPEQARTEARKLIGLLAQGINPNLENKRQRESMQAQIEAEQQRDVLEKTSLQSVLNDYLENRNLREKTAKDYVRFLKRCCGDWLKLPITELSRDMIQKRHLDMSAKHPAQANYTMRILRALFRYTMEVYEDSDGKPLLIHNPVDRLKHLRLWNRERRRQTVVHPHQLKDWYKAVCSLPYTIARDMLLLEIFTGARHSEAARLQWSHIDFHTDTILFVDTKNHEDHLFPMSSQLRQIMLARRASAGTSKYVFPGLNNEDAHVNDIRDSIMQVTKLTGIKFTEHDLRRTFETTAESLDISYYTLKRLLNHKTGSDPTAGYIVTSAERLREASQRVANELSSHMGLKHSKQKQSKARRYKAS